MSAITGTYRLQLHASFGFDDAARAVPYLADLGVSHLYLSPVLQAAPGSTHGYDVVDHDRVSEDLGGRDGLESLSAYAHSHGLGIVVDVVPNHMSLPTPASLNRPLWEMLRLGKEAPTAHWFDVDWDLCEGRLGLPLLGAPLVDALAQGELTLAEQGGLPVVRYYEQSFPVAPGTAGGSVSDVLDRQHYLLADWREKDAVLGYRRFFDIDTLVAVRVELEDVFDATHRLLVDLHSSGVIDGFRIDHPDGLADPRGYLERLRDATDGAWVVVEKILEGGETLPRSWAAAGTTGYDAAKAVQTVLAPPTGGALDRIWRDVEGAQPDLRTTERDAKRIVIADLFQPEVQRLVRRVVAATARTAEPLLADQASDALAVLLGQVEVYRAYVRLDEPVDADARALVDSMRTRAVAERPDLADALHVVCGLVLDSTSTDPDVRDLVVRFQQVCGPVMAKGVEDTTFYRWHRLVALDEVGGDPLTLDDPRPQALHDWAAEQQHHHPLGMTTLSTHDTKRSEDVRARLLAAGQDVEGWRALWTLVRKSAAELAVDEPTAYLLMQTVLGTWPIGGERLDAYMSKAVREAKQHTTWNDPDEDYERRVLALVARILEPGAASDLLGAWLEEIGPAIRAVTLGAKLLQLTIPGVPDIYQGCEVVSLALVDPDNRRPVDFVDHAERLQRLDRGENPRDLDDEKLLVTSRALRLRRDRPEAFGACATYRPLTSTSPHLVGFVRSDGVITLATRWSLDRTENGWADATVDLPEGLWTDVIGGGRTAGGPQVPATQIVPDLPVALLVRDSG